MKLATFRTAQGASYGAVVGKGIVDLRRYLGNQYPDLKSLIAANALDQAKKHLSAAPDYQASDVTWLPVIPNPDKIVCVGLNYQDHVVETKRDNTEQPAIFLRLPESQVGHKQPIVRPRESTQLDYEAEIAVIIGKPGYKRTIEDGTVYYAAVEAEDPPAALTAGDANFEDLDDDFDPEATQLTRRYVSVEMFAPKNPESVRETNTAVKTLDTRPNTSVVANPRIGPVPNWKRNAAAISDDTCVSTIVMKTRSKKRPSATALPRSTSSPSSRTSRVASRLPTPVQTRRTRDATRPPVSCR